MVLPQLAHRIMEGGAGNGRGSWSRRDGAERQAERRKEEPWELLSQVVARGADAPPSAV